MGDYVAASQEWRSLAEQGDVDAQYNLEDRDYAGLKAIQRLKEAAFWYRKAAIQVNSYAPGALGTIYA